MSCFDTFRIKTQYHCPSCHKDLSKDWQTKDLESHLMTIEEGDNTAKGIDGVENLSRYYSYNGDIECYDFCECGASIYAHVEFDEDGTFNTFELNRAYGKNDEQFVYNLKTKEWINTGDKDYHFNRKTKEWEIE